VRSDALIASLPSRTGRNLASWMRLLSSAEFQNKNQVIDYLRVRGFSFAEASTLERTHALGRSPFETTERLPTTVNRKVPRQTAPQQRRRDSAQTAIDHRATPTPFPRSRSAEEHAERLLQYLAEKHWRSGEVLSREVQVAYRTMCEELGWQVVGWRSVGSAFRYLIGDRKHYRHFVVDGVRHRWCCYSLPSTGSAAHDDRLEERIPVAAAA
jgi:hypothetical protein